MTAAALAYLASWLIVIAALFIVPRNRKPGSATAWLMLIVLLPYLGALIFLLIGSPKLSRRRREQQRTADERIAERVKEVKADPDLDDYYDPPIPARVEPFVKLTAKLGGMPACDGNRVELIADYGEAIRRMALAVDQAKIYAHVEFYIIALDDTSEPFVAALENAARRGVAVRLLIDHLASSRLKRRRELTARLTRAGVDWRWSLPLLTFEWNRPDLRNHRKLVIIDGRVGFTGSMNMIDSSYQRKKNLRSGMRYVETVARTEGPVVLELNAVFMSDWFAEGGAAFDTNHPSAHDLQPGWTGTMLCQALPSGPGYDNDNNLKLFGNLIHAARRTLFITTPYFVPDDSLMAAITSAAQRDVDVVLLTAGVSNQFLVMHAQHSFYEELLRAGVRIYLMQAPGLLHAKHMRIDDDIAVIGSSNLDMRSLTLNLEVTLIAYEVEVATALREVEAGLLRGSRLLTLEAWHEQPVTAKLLDNMARLTAALQ